MKALFLLLCIGFGGWLANSQIPNGLIPQLEVQNMRPKSDQKRVARWCSGDNNSPDIPWVTAASRDIVKCLGGIGISLFIMVFRFAWVIISAYNLDAIALGALAGYLLAKLIIRLKILDYLEKWISLALKKPIVDIAIALAVAGYFFEDWRAVLWIGAFAMLIGWFISFAIRQATKNIQATP